MEAYLEGHCYLLAIADYFTKRVEVIPLKPKVAWKWQLLCTGTLSHDMGNLIESAWMQDENEKGTLQSCLACWELLFVLHLQATLVLLVNRKGSFI